MLSVQFALVLVTVVTALDQKRADNFVDSVGDAICMETHCHSEWKACQSNKICLELMGCSSYCMETWDDDKTPQKVHAQNCTLKCAASYETVVSDDFMSCMFINDCLDFPPINVTCPAKLPDYVDPESSIADFKGEWWQHWGYNALWDCYPCQHIHSMTQMDSGDWAYEYSYEVFMVNNSLKFYEQTWDLPNPPKGVPIDITYTYMGTPHDETWYLLAATDDYLIHVDCSYIDTWTNVGSIIWVSPDIDELSAQQMSDIADVYANTLGWKFPDDFCQTQHGASCPLS